ncbi:hypothetical protein CJ030_MR2G016338 [Morella rubra]|uniref:Uncharacterized protein n=1 Tax=Morella rubra TaxID=262757 RepID=A0A6A1WGK6_9ROSI|nr:hypothetical protein CJ030_MR2G016338 [Morella rubra]
MSGVKRARTTRTGTGSSSQEQEVADPMMTLERRMEYLRGRPVAKERPVTLSDFDQLLYEEHSLYQLFEYQGFLHQLSWTEGFCVDTVVQDFFCALVSVDRAPEVQLEEPEGALTRRFARRAAAAAEEASRPSTSASEAPLETGAPAVPPPWVAQLFADLDSRVSATDHFDLDYTRHEDVRTVVETMMTARRTHRNRMHAYFKKFLSKEAALLKPHPDTTEEQWKELCDLFTSEAFMKRSEQNKKNRSKLTVNHAAGSRSFQRTRACMKNQESGNINPAELYKKNYTNKDEIWTSEGAREIYERMDAFQRQCDLEGKTYTEIEVYSEILGKKSGYVRGLGRAVKPPPSSTLTTQSSDLQHQLAKARDEIEAMRAAREKDLQEFAKKQAEMEATLRDHREEQRVEQERIRLEQEERMKREQERMRVEHEERMQQEQERMRKEQERLRAEISKELEKKMSSVMEKKMSNMSKRLFSQFGVQKVDACIL